jgi:hypothetical protein
MLNILQRVQNVEHYTGKMNQPLSQISGETAEFIYVTIQGFAKVCGYESIQTCKCNKVTEKIRKTILSAVGSE